MPAYAEAWNLHQLGHTDLDGHGDCMLVNVAGGVAYVGHMGGDRVGTSIVDVSNPCRPEVIAQIQTPEGTHSHKVQVVGDVLAVNHERNPVERAATKWSAGVQLYDVSDPTTPKPLGFLRTPGKGVHRLTYWEPPYAWVTGSDEGWSDQFLIVADFSDPEHPNEVGRWWYPGMHVAGCEEPTWEEGRRFALHHALVEGSRAYCGWWDAGLIILDVSDVTSPRLVSHLDFGREVSAATHTALPLAGRGLLVVTDEAITEDHAAIQKQVRIVDIGDETGPRVVSRFPVPEGDFAAKPGRFGPHNLHEMRPGSFHSDHIVHLTYFNAGLRVYDLTDPEMPTEIAMFLPPPTNGAPSVQLNDLTVDADGLIYVTDRIAGGLYIVEPEFALK